MRAGKLRHRLTIQQVSESQGPSGAPQPVYRTYAEVWGAVEPLRGREMFAAQELHSEITTRIRIRYLPGITTKMQVVFGTKTYLIIHPPIDQESRHREMQLMCKEIF